MKEVITIHSIATFVGAKAKGSLAGVCFFKWIPPESLLQQIAQANNFGVIVFMYPYKRAAASFTVRYFTALTEIEACGHASIAAGRFLFNSTGNSSALFVTAKGATIDVIEESGMIWIQYPAYSINRITVPAAILQSLQLTAYINAFLCTNLQTLFIETDNADELKKIQPDFKGLVAATGNLKEVVVFTIKTDGKYDAILRSFCPWIGIDEDPATGSIHAGLGPYLQLQLKKTKFSIFQSSAQGGEVFVKLSGTKVVVGGKAVIAHSISF